MLAYLGETVLNDWTPEGKRGPEQEACIDLFADLCERAHGTPAQGLVILDEKTQTWIPSPAFHRVMEKILQGYDNDVFWDELVHRFAQRDLDSEYGRETVDTMPDSYRRHAEKPLLDYYWKEVRENGMKNVLLRNETAKTPPEKEKRRRTSKKQKQLP